MKLPKWWIFQRAASTEISKLIKIFEDLEEENEFIYHFPNWIYGLKDWNLISETLWKLQTAIRRESGVEWEVLGAYSKWK